MRPQRAQLLAIALGEVSLLAMEDEHPLLVAAETERRPGAVDDLERPGPARQLEPAPEPERNDVGPRPDDVATSWPERLHGVVAPVAERHRWVAELVRAWNVGVRDLVGGIPSVERRELGLHEAREPVEQLGRERFGSVDRVGIAEEAQHVPGLEPRCCCHS